MNAFQRKFVNEVRRCEEMERKLRFLENEILKDKDKEIIMVEPQEFVEAPKPKEMIDLEVTFVIFLSYSKILSYEDISMIDLDRYLSFLLLL